MHIFQKTKKQKTKKQMLLTNLEAKYRKFLKVLLFV